MPLLFIIWIAKSRNLKINIKREVLKEGADGLVEDTRFNRPAKDGEKYTDEGIYTITVKNIYTGQDTKTSQSNIFESYSGNDQDLNDETLLRFIQDSIYSDLVSQLDIEDYFVESVNTIYVSQEYLEEQAYNS